MKKKLLLLLKLLITIGILYYIFTYIPISEVVSSIAQANIMYIVLGIALTLIIRYAEAYQMKIITCKQGLTLSVWRIYEISIIVAFYSLFLPGYIAGGALRWYKFAQHDNMPAEALASIVFHRLIRVIIVIILGILCWIVDTDLISHYNIGRVLIVPFLVVCALCMVLFSKKFSFVRKSIGQLIDSKYIHHSIKEKIRKLANAMIYFKTLSANNLLSILILALGGELLAIFTFYLFAVSIDLNLSYFHLGWMRSIIHIAAMLPISFSGIGIREGGLIYMLQPYGISASLCVALSFILFGQLLFIAMLGGLIEGTNTIMSHAEKRRVL